MRIRPIRALLARSDQAGTFAAAATASQTFQRTLMPRNDVDQAGVTGLTMWLNYLIASLVHDGIESTAGYVLLGPGQKKHTKADEDQLRRVTLAFGAAGMVGGMALQMAFPQRPGEPLRVAAARTTGFWLSLGAFSGFFSGAAQEALTAIDRRGSRDFGLRHLPVPLIAGTAFATVREIQRRRRERSFGITEGHTGAISGAKAIGMGTGIGTALVAMVAANRAFAHVIGLALDKALPGDERLWRPIGHAASLGMIGALIVFQLDRVNQKIEAGAGKVEDAFETPPNSPYVSGTPASAEQRGKA